MIRFIPNDEIRLCIETRGQGPEHLLFAHGWISSRRIWTEVCDRLDPARFTMHLLDFRGAGLSDRPRAGHDLAGYGSDLRAAIAAAGHPLTVVAHSAGAKIAQFVACGAAGPVPAEVKRLILVAPGTASRYPTSARHRARAEEAYGSRERIEAFQRASMAIAPEALGPGVMQRLVDDALVAQYEAWMGWYDHGRTADFSECLKDLKQPCIALVGERDGLSSERRVRAELTERIERSQLISLLGMGHNLPIEAPEAVAQVISRLTPVG